MSENIWEDVFNVQKSMFESWQKAVMPGQDGKDKAENNPFGAFNPYQNYLDMAKNMQNMQAAMNQWQGMLDNWNNLNDQWKKYTEQNPYFKNKSEAFKSYELPQLDFAPLKAWQKLMEIYNPVEMSKLMSKEAKDVFEKSINANQFKLATYKMWEDLKRFSIDPASEDFEAKASEMSAKYEELLQEYLMPMIPAEMRTFVTRPHKVFKDGLGFLKNFSAPWMENYGVMADLMMQAALKDPKQSQEMLKLWKENYDKTVGELMKSPVCGSNRELIEQQNKAVDSLVDMTLAMSEYIGSIMNVASEKYKEGFEKYIELVQKGEQPQTFNEFYKYLSDKVENAIDNFYFTDEFSQIIGKATDSYMQFKVESDKLVERYLSDTPIITVSKVDNAFKNVYDLKKEVRNLNKKIAALEKKIEETKPAAKTVIKPEKKSE